MEDFNIQKLISIFLGLAILISSATLILSGFLDFNSNSQNITNNQKSNDESDLKNKSAFVESPKDLPNYYGYISSNDKEFIPSGNLTDDFASYAALEIVKTNPDGPQIDETGSKNITIPDIEKISDNFVNNFISEKSFNYDLEKELENSYSKIKIIDNSSSSIIFYLNNFNNISKKYLSEKDINALLLNDNYNNSAVNLEALTQLNNDFYKEISGLEVPENFLNFHKKFLKILVYQKEVFNNSQKINNDPLYVYYFLEKIDPKISNSINEFEQEAKKISQQYLFNQNFAQQEKFLLISLFEKLIFIQKAHAFLGLPSIVFDPAAVGQLIKKHWDDIRKWLKTLFTEVVKDQLIHRLVNQVIQWVQGGGKPQFITNWQEFLSDAVSRGVGETLRQIDPRICQPFRPLLQIAFQNVNTYDKNVSCTLGDIVNNLQNFYNNFKYGGWISYASVIQPQNNFFGTLIISRDLALQKAASQKESQKSDAQSSKGFLSMKICVKQKTIIQNMDKESLKVWQLEKNQEIKCNKDKSTGAELCSIIECEQYKNTTPGALIGDTIGNSIAGGPIGRIVNAQDITALVSALVNSGLNKLINAGVKGLTGVLTNKNEVEEGAVSNSEDACYGLIPGTEEYNNCRNITNNNLYNIDLGEEKTNIIQQARTTLDQINNAIKADRDWLNYADEVQIALKTIGGCSSASTSSQSTALCPNLANQACSLNDNIENSKQSINQEISILSKQKTNISNIIEETDEKEVDLQKLQEIQKELSGYNDVSLSKPQQRLNSLLELKSIAEQNISESPQCSIPLPLIIELPSLN